MWDATPFLRLRSARRRRTLAAQNAAEAQRRTLRRLIGAAARTQFGRDHGFEEIGSVEEYQARVPLWRYEGLWQEYWKARFPVLTDITWPGTVPYFAQSSGTTSGVTKYIPCTKRMLRANLRAGFDLLVHHIAAKPDSRVLGGRSFMLGGSSSLTELAPGIHGGDLSGIATARIPGWLASRVFPPPAIARIRDWEQRVAALAPLALTADIRALGGTPSWLLMFFEMLAQLRPDLPPVLASHFPNLELLVHGGVNFAPYRARFAALLEGSGAELREAYAASEGFIAVADRGPGEGLRMILDNGLFFELVPVEELDAAQPTRHWLGNAETGVNYALAVSSCAGLWSCLIGDTVRLIERDPARLLITGRSSYMLSAFGEHLIGEEIETAVTDAAAAIGVSVVDFAAGAVFPTAEDARSGGHVFVVEFDGGVPEPAPLARFAAVLDERLAALNRDYQDHRIGFAAPRILPAPPGAFAAWMKSRGKLGAQHKVPRVINDQALLAGLQDFVNRDR